MKRITALVLVFCLLLSLMPASLGEALGVDPIQGVLHPGGTMTISFTLPEDGPCDIALCAEDGRVLMTVAEDYEGSMGSNRVLWNGIVDGQRSPEGNWLLTVTQNGLSASAPIEVGDDVPSLTVTGVSAEMAAMGEQLIINYQASCAGTLTLGVL